MATIGSIGIAFEAEASSLLSGVDSAVSSLQGLGEAIKSVQDRLRGLADVASVSVRVEASGLDDIEESVSSLESASGSARGEIEDLGTAIEETGQATRESSSAVNAFAREATAALSATAEEAIAGTEGFVSMRDSVTGLRDVAVGTLNAVSETSSQAAVAVTGVSAAFGSLSADTAIVAAGRTYDAYQSVVRLFQETIPNAYVAAGTAATTLFATMGGLSTVVAAFGGSVAATSIAVGSLTASLASAVAAVATYSGVVAIAEAASAGLSEESQAYVERAARVGGAMLSAAAAATVAAGTFRIVATSMFAATSVSDGLARILQGLATSASGLSGPLGAALATVNALAVGFRVMDAAADGSASRLLAIAANSAVTTAAVGAIGGVMTSAASGTGVLAAALGGASTALAGLAAALPGVAALAVTANVAFAGLGDSAVRFRQHMGQAAQQLGDLSDRFGQSVQEMERLRIAAGNAGVSITQVTRAQQNFYSSLSKVKIGQLGTNQAREAKAAFDRLKISADELNGASPEEVFERVAKQLTEIQDPAKKTQIAMDLFGRTGPAILPMLKSMGSLSAEIDRLGGLISDIDFKRFTDMNSSFDRLRVASGALADDLQIPFTRMQEAMNNAGAEIRGGFAQVVGAIGEMIADASTPLAVLIEMFARVTGTILRIAAAVLKLVGVFQVFATVAAVAELIGEGFKGLFSYVEAAVKAFEQFASLVEEYLGDSVDAIMGVGEAMTKFLNIFTNLAGLGDVFGPVTASILAVAAAITWAMASSQAWTMVMATTAGTAIASAVTTAAAWVAASAAIVVGLTAAAIAIGVYYVGMVLLATATTIASCAAMHVAWLFGLGPIGLIIAAVELLVVGIAALWAVGSGIADFFSGWGEGKEKIDGATASTEELAAAVAENEKRSEPGFLKDLEAVSRAAGATEEEIAMLRAEAGAALAEMGFEIDVDSVSAEEAAESIRASRDSMAELSIEAARLGQVGADAVASASEEFNDLQRQLADGKIELEEFNTEADRIRTSLSEGLEAAKKASPEETLKKNLELFKQLDDAAKGVAKSVRDIGAGVQIGDKFFPRSAEVKARAQEYADEYTDALDGIKQKLATGGFQADLDARRAENERAFTAGEIDSQTFNRTKRELDTTSAQEQASIAAEEVQRELDRNNAKLKVDLDFADNIRKSLETAFLSPVEKFQKELDKIRANPELTDEEKALAEKDLRKNAREGLIGKTPVESFNDRQRDLQQGALSGLISNEEMRNDMLKNADELARALGVPVNPANQMEVAISELDAALKAGSISVEQHSDGLKAARRSFLESLGIKTAAEEIDADKLNELERQRSAGKITDEEFGRGRQAIEDDIIGQSSADEIAERRRRIESGIASGAVGDARGEAALRSLDADRRSAAGIENTAGQQLQLGVDRINDAFGVAGQTIQEIQSSLSPEEFAEYQKAIEENTNSVRESLGVEKSVGDVLGEAEERLAQAVRDGVISREEADAAFKKQRDEILSSLGIDKSPVQEFEEAAERLAEAAGEKAITEEELAQGARKIRDNLLNSLGIPLDPVNQLRERMENLRDAVDRGVITQEEFTRGQEEARKAALPGGQEESPLKQFQRDMDTINRAAAEGLIGKDDAEQRRNVLRADLQENLKPALEAVAPDRRQVGASDVRSRGGVDTFFRILQGRDNPSLKAQLAIARNTQILADAQNAPEAVAVIAQLSAR